MIRINRLAGGALWIMETLGGVWGHAPGLECGDTHRGWNVGTCTGAGVCPVSRLSSRIHTFASFMIERFTKEQYPQLCAELAGRDRELEGILSQYGLPPFWVRPNRFETLVLTILEQQVSLASAYAAYKKLKERVDKITPEAILSLSDEALRACYFSRQKIGYVRGLATALAEGRISLKRYHYLPDDEVRSALKQLKGIGDWTVDIYLLHALRRTDIFPLGDLALINALKEVKGFPAARSKEDLLALAEPWRPYRSIATMILWHSYIQKRKIRVEQ